MIEFMKGYLDMLFEYVQPKQLLFIAIDGPPPRAKMMQQRERRFVHQYEAKMSANNDSDNEWDSNQITPGTAFMVKVAKGLSKYIEHKLSNECDENEKLKIILSDSSVPGEGEHKILDFIRNLRSVKDYDSSSKHLLFSNDADMILLALLLHERNVYLMRDVPQKQSIRKKSTLFSTKFNVIDLKQLTKYLLVDLDAQKLNYQHFEYDIDRVIDDFVFLSYFVGNDFIPCLPFMNMRDGAFQYLLSKYMETATALPSYLVNGCNVNFDAVIVYLNHLEKEESEILKYRAECFLERTDPNNINNRKQSHQKNKRRKLNDGSSESQNGAINKLCIDELNKKCKADLNFIKFGTNGYKTRYYRTKFQADYDKKSNEFVNEIKLEYIRALSWIQHYYYNGIVSWSWHYLYHFAPLISDIVQIDSSKYHSQSLWSEYPKGAPLPPLTQLALVMPSKSAKITLPASYYDAIFGKNSQLKQFYPDSFAIDLNFKMLNWESTAIIAHVDVDFLQSILDKCSLNKAFKAQNEFHCDVVYMQSKDKNFKNQIFEKWNCSLIDDEKDDDDDLKVYKFEINIPNALNLSREHRKCERSNDAMSELKAVNESELNIVSQTMCKFFMAGRQSPRQIIKYMNKRPSLWKKSVRALRESAKRKRKQTVMSSVNRMRLKKQNEKNEKKKKNERTNNEFVSKLKSIGMRREMNGNNASQLIIDSVLSAMMTSKNNKNKNEKKQNENENDNKKEIKMKVKTSKAFENKKKIKIKYAENVNNAFHGGSKKKKRRKMKREKLQKMLKGGGIDIVSMKMRAPSKKMKNLRKKKVEQYGQYPIHKKGNQENERNAQIQEVQSLLDSNDKKKNKKKKKWIKKRKRSQMTE